MSCRCDRLEVVVRGAAAFKLFSGLSFLDSKGSRRQLCSDKFLLPPFEGSKGRQLMFDKFLIPPFFRKFFQFLTFMVLIFLVFLIVCTGTRDLGTDVPIGDGKHAPLADVAAGAAQHAVPPV
tara:strand:- start:486 stop:851 length:366 start_codon:yes stop_codon:yes gene_type:complete